MELYSTFEAFRPHFEGLARCGYYKIVMKNVSYLTHVLHQFYRVSVGFLVVLYNLQHLIKAVQSRHSTDQMVDTLFILLTTINAFGKQLTINARSRRIDRLIATIKGPEFAATNQHHENIMKKNALEMSRLLKLYQISVITCGSLWTIFPFVNKALGLEVNLTAYFPFDTDTSPVFEIAHMYMSILITFQAYGHVTMDSTVVAFYAQVKVQIQVLRYNLEHLAEDSNERISDVVNLGRVYKENVDKRNIVQRRLAKCVEHYRLIVWFFKEVESIFWEAMFIQFFVMAWIICMTVYKIVGLSIFSVEFVSITVYLGCMLAQLFAYCYYGTQVKIESEFINQSVFTGDWVRLPSSLRRQLLILMEYCSRPLVLRIANLIPMSLETYINVLRSSYTLFTVIDRR